MTNADESAKTPSSDGMDEEIVHDGTDPSTTDVSDDLDIDMIRDDVQNEDHS